MFKNINFVIRILCTWQNEILIDFQGQIVKSLCEIIFILFFVIFSLFI